MIIMMMKTMSLEGKIEIEICVCARKFQDSSTHCFISKISIKHLLYARHSILIHELKKTCKI